MTEVKWIKLSVNMFNDEKIKLIRTMPEGDKIIVVWVQLLCLAGKTNDNGGIYMGQSIYYTDEMLATLCDQPVNIMRIALKTLTDFDMIQIRENGLIEITNWDKHQSTDKLARLNEKNRERQQKYYYRKKLREIGFEEKDMPDDLDELKELYEKPNVRLTLPNDTEVRSKKLEDRSKKEEERGKNYYSSDQQSQSLSNDYSEISNFYQNNFGVLSNYIAQDLSQWLDDLNKDLVIRAMQKAIEGGKNYSYAKGIMKNWAQNGIKTLEDAEAEEKSFRNKGKKTASEPRYELEWNE